MQESACLHLICSHPTKAKNEGRNKILGSRRRDFARGTAASTAAASAALQQQEGITTATTAASKYYLSNMQKLPIIGIGHPLILLEFALLSACHDMAPALIRPSELPPVSVPFTCTKLCRGTNGRSQTSLIA